MVAAVIEKLSPKDQRSKLLLEKLTIIQEAQVSAVSAAFAAASNLQLLKNFGFQPQVLSCENGWVHSKDLKEELQNRVRSIRRADRMAGSSVTFVQKTKDYKTNTKVTSAAKKSQSRTSVFGHLGSPAASTGQRTVTQEQSFRAGSGKGARHWPYPDQRSRTKKSTTASSAGRRWRGPGGGSPGRLRPALEESAEQLPGHRHCRGWCGSDIPTKTSTDPPVHQLPDQEQPTKPPASWGCLAVEGGHRAGHQRDIPRVLQPTVPGSQEDGRSSSGSRSFHSQPPYGSSTLQDGDTGIRTCGHQRSRVDSVHRYPQRIFTCPDATSRPEVSALCGQQESLPIHLSTLRIGNVTSRVHQALATSRSAVKAARCEAARLLKCLADPCRYSRTGATAFPDNHQCAPVSRLDHQLREVRNSKSGIPVHRDAVQHSTIHIGAPPEDASQSPVRSSTLDDQPKHHSPRSAQITGRAGVHGFTGTMGKTPSSSGPVVGRHSMVPEDQELDRPDHSSSVGAVRGGLVGISSSPARSFPRHQGDESDSLHGCVQFGLGSPVRLTLDSGTMVSISKTVAHQCSGDAGRHQCCERLPASSEVPGGSLDVQQCREAHDHIHWCWWRYACSSGEIARRSGWSPSICQECTTSRWIRCPEWARHWTPSERWPWSVYDTCLPNGTNHRSTCLRHSPTDDSSSLYRHIRTPGPSGRKPCPCPGTTGGASCMHSRLSRCSPQFCKRSLSHQASGWFWSLHCNRQLHGFQSWWIWHRKIQSRCSLRVKICWLKTFWSATGWPRLVTTGRQIYTRGNSTGRPEGQGPFQGSCSHDVKVPSWLIDPSVWIPLGKIHGVLQVKKMARVSSQKS